MFEENGLIWNPRAIEAGPLSGRPPAETGDSGHGPPWYVHWRKQLRPSLALAQISATVSWAAIFMSVKWL